MATRAYNNDVKAAIHETALDLHDARLIDKHTMRRFDQSCLTPVRKFSAAEIRALRDRLSARAKSRGDSMKTVGHVVTTAGDLVRQFSHYSGWSAWSAGRRHQKRTAAQCPHLHRRV